MIRCLGGWCVSRDRCAHYWQDGDTWSERLCDKNLEEPEPIREMDTRNQIQPSIRGMEHSQVLR